MSSAEKCKSKLRARLGTTTWNNAGPRVAWKRGRCQRLCFNSTGKLKIRLFIRLRGSSEFCGPHPLPQETIAGVAVAIEAVLLLEHVQCGCRGCPQTWTSPGGRMYTQRNSWFKTEIRAQGPTGSHCQKQRVWRPRLHRKLWGITRVSTKSQMDRVAGTAMNFSFPDREQLEIGGHGSLPSPRSGVSLTGRPRKGKHPS